MLFLSDNDLRKALDLKSCIEQVEGALYEQAAGTADVPKRTIIDVKKHSGACFFMPAYLRHMDALGIKIVTAYGDNPSKGLPTIFGLVILNDADTGRPLAVMDGRYVTAMRTGAVAGVATKYLAREEIGRAGLIGCGYQAKTQLLALKEVRSPKVVMAFDLDLNKASRFAEEASGELGLDVKVAATAEMAVRGADLVITATTAREPVLRAEWISPGAHINSIDWMGPNAREIDSETVARSRVVVDTREGVLSESGDVLLAIEEGAITEGKIDTELGEVVAGRKKGRGSDEEVTLFKTVGLATFDVATAHLAYRKAVEIGLGLNI